jgi:hypothetical protein
MSNICVVICIVKELVPAFIAHITLYVFQVLQEYLVLKTVFVVYFTVLLVSQNKQHQLIE